MREEMVALQPGAVEAIQPIPPEIAAMIAALPPAATMGMLPPTHAAVERLCERLMLLPDRFEDLALVTGGSWSTHPPDNMGMRGGKGGKGGKGRGGGGAKGGGWRGGGNRDIFSVRHMQQSAAALGQAGSFAPGVPSP